MIGLRNDFIMDMVRPDWKGKHEEAPGADEALFVVGPTTRCDDHLSNSGLGCGPAGVLLHEGHSPPRGFGSTSGIEWDCVPLDACSDARYSAV